MITRNKTIEDRLRSEGYLKLQSKNQNSHRYRYMAPGNATTKSIVCIENGAVYGVFLGSGWEDKYILVDWNTPDCDCDMCKLNEGGEEMSIISSGFVGAIRNMNNLDYNIPVDIYGLNVSQSNNGWNKVEFYYRIKD